MQRSAYIWHIFYLNTGETYAIFLLHSIFTNLFCYYMLPPNAVITLRTVWTALNTQITSSYKYLRQSTCILTVGLSSHTASVHLSEPSPQRLTLFTVIFKRFSYKLTLGPSGPFNPGTPISPGKP